MKGEFKYAKIYKLFIARNVIAIKKYKLIFGNYLLTLGIWFLKSLNFRTNSLRTVDNCYLTQTTPAYYLTFII